MVKIGYIGLGRMGKNMVLHLLEKGIEVIAFNRSPQPLEEVVKAGATGVKNLEDLVSSLRGESATKQSDKEIATGPSDPRNDNDGVMIWLMLPAGNVTDEFIAQLTPLLYKGDLLIDGANSFYKDTLRRADDLQRKGVHFMDIGVSGGPNGARNGACLMIGGSDNDFQKVEELAKAAAAPDSYQHLGPVGAGHFAKMVHNGIEYGMMESIAEGAAILKNSPFNFDLRKVFDIYNHKSVIESRLVGWLLEAFSEDTELFDTDSKIASTGEGDWTLDTAKEMGINIPTIESAVDVRSKSADDPEDSPEGFRNKAVSAMRGKFGQHSVKKSKVL